LRQDKLDTSIQHLHEGKASTEHWSSILLQLLATAMLQEILSFSGFTFTVLLNRLLFSGLLPSSPPLYELDGIVTLGTKGVTVSVLLFPSKWL